jgi:AraC-like DNA-binding protein
LEWPLRCLGRPVLAGSFPIRDRAFEVGYLSPTHAFHVYEYEADIMMGGELRRLRPGDATISPAGMETRYRLQKPGRHWCIHFEAPGHTERRAAHVTLPLHAQLGAQQGIMTDAVARIAALLNAPSAAQAASQAAASAALQELLLRLVLIGDANSTDRPLRSHHAVEIIAEQLDERFDRAIDVPALAAAAGIDQNYLARRFRARFGMTIQRYVLARRIARAQLLLRTTDMPIARIATLVGFGDAQHFNKQFRRVAGVNPSGYRLSG